VAFQTQLLERGVSVGCEGGGGKGGRARGTGAYPIQRRQRSASQSAFSG